MKNLFLSIIWILLVVLSKLKGDLEGLRLKVKLLLLVFLYCIFVDIMEFIFKNNYKGYYYNKFIFFIYICKKKIIIGLDYYFLVDLEKVFC